MKNDILSYVAGAAGGLGVILCLMLVVSAIASPKPPITPSAVARAADEVCHQLALMHEEGTSDALASIGIVRCAILEEARK